MALNILTRRKKTYNPLTGVYTNERGQSFSTATPPSDATIVYTTPKKTISGGGGGGTYNPDTGVYTNPQGQGFSTATPPPSATIVRSIPPSSSSIQQQQQKLAIAKQQQEQAKPRVFFSSKEGWKPKVGTPSDVVVYTRKGKTTGQTSVEGVRVQEGVAVGKTYQYQGEEGRTETGLGADIIAGEFSYENSMPQDVSTVLEPAMVEQYNLESGTYTSGGQGYSMSLQNVPEGTQLKGKTAVIGTKSQPLKEEGFSIKDIFGLGLNPTEPQLVTFVTPKIIDFVAGETGKKYIGLGVNPTEKSLITGEQIKTFTLKNAPVISKITKINPLVIQTGAEFIPATPLDVATYGIGAGLVKAPVILRVPISAGATYLGAKGTLNPSLTPSQRAASGLVAVGGGFGTLAEVLPYGRGLYNIASVKEVPYSAVRKQELGFKAVEIPKEEINTIGLIPRGSPLKEGVTKNVQLPKASPLVRGGFEVKASEKVLFTNEGKKQWLATSQQSLFKEGVDIPIEREFFVTPQEPTLKIPETRVSRLGINEGLFTLPKESEIGFGIPKKPQIGLTYAKVGFKETPKSFVMGTTTELEAIKSYGTIQDVKKIAVTNINLQGVDVYTYGIGKGKKTGVTQGYQGTSYSGTRISGESILGVSGTRIKTTQKTVQFIPSYKLSSIRNLTTTKTLRKTSITSTRISLKAVPSSKKTYGKIPTYLITSPKTTPSQRIYKTTPITKPTFYPPYPPIKPPRPPVPSRKERLFGTPKYTKETKSYGGFSVFLRRFGKFKPIGTNLGLEQAFTLGKERTRTTLGATFEVRGAKARNIYGYKTKPTKKGIYYIELPKYRLSTPSEKTEISYYRRLKGGRRK